jgi:c-di-GMP-binding flagellar brake protein YcgR
MEVKCVAKVSKENAASVLSVDVSVGGMKIVSEYQER